MLKNVLNLNLVKWWVTHNPNSNLATLINKLISEKTSISIKNLDSVSDRVVEGVVGHRLPDSARPRASKINSLLTMSTYICVITDTATHYAKSTKDYSLCFQSNLLTIESQIAHNMCLDQSVFSNLAAEIECELCTEVFEEVFYDLSETSSYQGLNFPNRITEIQAYNRSILREPDNIDVYTSFAIHEASNWFKALRDWKSQGIVVPGETANMGMTHYSVNLTEYTRLSLKPFCLYLSLRIFNFNGCSISQLISEMLQPEIIDPFCNIFRQLDTVLAQSGHSKSVQKLFKIPITISGLHASSYIIIKQIIIHSSLDFLSVPYVTPNFSEPALKRLTKTIN